VARDPEADYFQSVEEYFVSRRGDPLFLSNADWLLVRKWRRAGVPLRVVLRGIADALDGHAHSFGRDQKVRSLQYCAAEVDAAAERWRRALALGAEERTGSPAAILLSLAEALEGARLGPASSRVARELAGELRARTGEAPAEISSWLGAAEKRLLRALARDAGAGENERLEEEVDAVLAPYRARMPEAVLQQIRQESLARRRLEAQGLPRLSLFHGISAEAGGAA
jgi:hypothetical protein